MRGKKKVSRISNLMRRYSQKRGKKTVQGGRKVEKPNIQ